MMVHHLVSRDTLMLMHAQVQNPGAPKSFLRSSLLHTRQARCRLHCAPCPHIPPAWPPSCSVHQHAHAACVQRHSCRYKHRCIAPAHTHIWPDSPASFMLRISFLLRASSSDIGSKSGPGARLCVMHMHSFVRACLCICALAYPVICAR